MGLFGGSKTYVASTLYNLAGEVASRPQFLKNLVIGNVLSGSSTTVAETLQGGLMNGPGIQLRNYYRWAQGSYSSTIGSTTGGLVNNVTLDPAVVFSFVAHSGTETVIPGELVTDLADYSHWAEQWMLENAPAEIDTAWVADISDTTGEITIHKASGDVSFTPADYDKQGFYIFASYALHSSVVGVADTTHIFIYRFGSGNSALDDMMGVPGGLESYFPPIPVRLNNQFISTSNLPDVYSASAKAYKKLTNGDFSKLITDLSDNPSLADLDYIYVAVGVPLNVIENASKKYIYNFLHHMHLSSLGGSGEVRVATSGNAAIGFDMRVSWSSISETTGSGLVKPDAKVGQLWVEGSGDGVVVSWQVTAGAWKTLTAAGLVHKNYVYQGNYVQISTSEALADADESGFLFPLHYGVWTAMSLVDQTQMATACLYLVINTYQVVKQKWYQTGIFKIILFIAIVVIAIYFGPVAGTLGGTIGTALGLTGMTFAIAAAVINAIAAMILMQLTMDVLVKAVGAKNAAIIMAVMVVLSIASGGGVPSFQNMAQNMGNMMRAENILRITMAVGNGVANYAQAEVQDLVHKVSEVEADYNKQSKSISDLYAQNIGYGSGIIDPLALISASSGPNIVLESEDAFLTRTLMTGSDVAQMSLDLVTNFADLTLTSELPI